MCLKMDTQLSSQSSVLHLMSGRSGINANIGLFLALLFYYFFKPIFQFTNHYPLASSCKTFQPGRVKIIAGVLPPRHMKTAKHIFFNCP